MSDPTHPSWRTIGRSLTDLRVLRIGVLGFSAGLPLLLVFGTLSFWLREAGVDRSTIGFISWIALAYALKVFWAPLVDQLPLPGLTRWFGRRRSWLLLTQTAIVGGLLGMAYTDPAQYLSLLIGLALWVAVASATQDLVIDAYRIEIADADLQGILAGVYATGYRIAMLVASGGVLWIAAWVDPDEAQYEHVTWTIAYVAMAVCMLPGLITTWFAPEPMRFDAPSHTQSDVSTAWTMRLRHWLSNAICQPFADFIRRYGWLALLILALIASYRISDIVLGVIANVFYKDMGFAKDEIALVAKGFGIYMTILGGLVGGIAVYRIGVMPMLLGGAVLAAGTNLLFMLLATVGNDFWLFVAVIGMDNLSAGLASAAFIAYLSALTNVAYSATQYALFSSLMLLLPKFFGGFSGVFVDTFGYPDFFLLTAGLGIPVILLVMLAWRYTQVTLPPR